MWLFIFKNFPCVFGKLPKIKQLAALQGFKCLPFNFVIKSKLAMLKFYKLAQAQDIVCLKVNFKLRLTCHCREKLITQNSLQIMFANHDWRSIKS
jgi:hypothetical protein